MFYTYAHYRPNGLIFYIGKGSGDRHLSLSRSAHWKNIVSKNGGFTSEIIARWPTEAEAFEHEKFLIQCFRDLGFDLCNKTSGGEGTSGLPRSAETLKKLSRSLSGERNPNFGKVFSEETRLKMSIASKKTMSNPEVRAKIGASSKLRKHSEETKLKIQASWLDPESRAARIAAINAGNAKSKAQKAKTLQIAEGASV